ncbi:NAD-dependent epimerase/dehydratase family protein [Candidatus Ventrimonas sp. KK005]|nr:NAD-dependent epimerase/dehydratase family protein [Lachnospiraceae bacterium]NBH17755.1 NAD-dependent epimerase/dehydratase family protein [Clostridiaceae bacterium]
MVQLENWSGEKENDKNKKTVLVTGATGFLGEYLVRRLVGKYRVLGLGRNVEKGKKLEELGAIFCQGDFTDRESCQDYFKGVQYVIHGGARSSVWGKWEDFYKDNVMGTDLVAKLCFEQGVRRLVYVSSPSIYTAREDRYNIDENEYELCENRKSDQVDLNYYIKSKKMAERIIRQWNERGLETVILRPRGLIGIGDTSLVPRLLRANRGVGIPLFRDGRNLVDLTCVENAALACCLAMSAKEASGEIFNITNGEPFEFRELLEGFLKAAGERPHYRKMPFGLLFWTAAGLEWIYRKFKLPGEPFLTRYAVCTLGFAQTLNINRARDVLGYKPEKRLKDAVREYGTWWRNGKKNEQEYRGSVKVRGGMGQKNEACE